MCVCNFVFSYWNENVSHFNQDNKKVLHNNPNKEWLHFIENEKYTVFRRKLQSGLFEYRGMFIRECISMSVW